MATLQGKAVKNTYRQVLQIGANNVGVSGSLQPVQDGAGVNTALSLSTAAATINGNLTITGDLIITGGGIEIKELIDDTVAALIKNGTGITWTYNDGAASLTGNFTGTTSVVPEGSNLYYTQGRFDSAFAAKSTTNLAEGSNLYFTAARGNANFATNLAASDTDDLAEGVTNLYYTNTRARTALSITAGTGLSYNNTTGVFNLAAIPNASLTNSSITINGQAVSLGSSVTLTTTNIGEGTNLYWTEARGNANFTTNLAASSTTNLAEGSNLYYTQARFDTAFSNKSTTNLAEGTNLYYTQARFNSALAAKTTTDLAEGTNLYYTDARSRLALSSSATGLSYANNSGVFSLTAGYAIPTTVKLGQYDIAYNRSIVSAAVSGTSTKTLSLTQQDANVITATWTDQGITTINGTANQIATTTVGNTTTVAFTNDVTMPNNLVVSGNLTINGTATYVNTQSISAKDPLFEVANDNNTTDAVDIGYYGRYYDTPQTRVEFTGLFRDASDAGKFKFFTGLVDEPTNVVNTTGTGYTVGTLVANFEGNLAGTANAANALSTARTIAASGDAVWSVSFDGSANVSSALTLANTGVTATNYGTSTAVPTIAVDSKGRITSASNTNIAFPVTSVNGAGGTVVLTTTNIAEGSNQYFTTGRVAAYLTGAISTVLTADLTASRAVASNASGKLVSSGTTDTELGYLSGVTSAVQTQLNSKLNLTGGTLTGGLSGTTGTFSGILTTPQVKAATSAGLSINANSGTQVADFGAGGSANITFFGGLAGTSATFSGALTVTNNVTIRPTSGYNAYFQTSGTALRTNYLNDALSANVSASFRATDYSFQDGSGGAILTLASTSAATFSSSVTAANFKSYLGNLATLRTYAKAPEVELSSYGSTPGFPFTKTTDLVANADSGADSQLRILTATTGSNPETRILVSSNGNIGVNTNSPVTKLHIVTTDYIGQFIQSNYLNSSKYYSSTLIGYAAVANQAAEFGYVYDSVTAANSYSYINTVGVAQGGQFAITAAGKVGISTINPTEKLEVINGALSISTTNTGVSTLYGRIAMFSRGLSDAYITYGGEIRSYSGAGVDQSDLRFYTSQGTGTTERLRITPFGNVGIVSLSGTGSRTVLADASGNLSAPVSDISVKENITTIGYGLNEILKMNPVWFNFIDDYKNYGEGRQNGNIAQEMEAIIPEAVFTTPSTGKMGINYDQLHAVYIKAIQELEARIKELEAK